MVAAVIIKVAHARATDDFFSWGHRDCDLGIRDLVLATGTIAAKRSEYQVRRDHLRRLWQQREGEAGGRPRAQILHQRLQAIHEMRDKLSSLERSLEPFCRLPPDLTLAALELERARHRLAELISQRDALLGNYRRGS